MRTALLCASIGLNAFCAGGMFTFPLLSPALATYYKFSQTQLTTIILTGMISQYPLSLPVGSIVDKRGPALCSLVAGLLFATGFGVIASQTVKVPAGDHASSASFYWLIFSYLCIGTSTIFSYGSSLFTASKAFPTHIGLASASAMVSFSLSPLFFSQIATTFFIDTSTGFLKIAPFATFVALLTLVVHTFGFFNYRRLAISASGSFEEPPVQQSEETPITDETTPLIASEEAPVHVTTHPSPPSLRDLLKQPDMWILALFCVLIVGSCEMVISNIGMIAESLPASNDRPTSSQKHAGSSAALQVKVLSITNTASRLIIGPLADYVSPMSVFLPTGIRTFTRKHMISRFAFLAGAATLISLTFFWMSIGITTQAELWALSAGTGLSYSATFTILPSLISSMWGLQHLGRNFGLMMFAPATGTPLFSYLYALISTANTEPGTTSCKGRICWELTFSITTTTSVFALLLSLVLWRRWHGTI